MTKIRPTLVAILLSIWATASHSCSLGGYERFSPEFTFIESVEDLPNLEKISFIWQLIPTPVVEIISVKRGTTAPGFECTDFGRVYLRVSIPEGSIFPLKDFGIYFRLKHGQMPDMIFPSAPVTGTAKGGEIELMSHWLDGHPSTQQPIWADVEVFLVTHDLNIGESGWFSFQVD